MDEEVFPVSGFEDWSATYDADVGDEKFPFLGYSQVLRTVVALAGAKAGARVLDVGTGTGNLAQLFSSSGCELWCTDFSPAMLEKARLKLPRAHFALQDVRAGLPEEFPPRFDCIVSAYVFHHFKQDEKIGIIVDLSNHLKPSGKLIIADIAFPDKISREKAMFAAGNDWEEEFYWIASEDIPAFGRRGLKVKYGEVSSCAGVFSFRT